jgi:hypothetical protein
VLETLPSSLSNSARSAGLRQPMVSATSPQPSSRGLAAVTGSDGASPYRGFAAITGSDGASPYRGFAAATGSDGPRLTRLRCRSRLGGLALTRLRCRYRLGRSLALPRLGRRYRLGRSLALPRLRCSRQQALLPPIICGI